MKIDTVADVIEAIYYHNPEAIVVVTNNGDPYLMLFDKRDWEDEDDETIRSVLKEQMRHFKAPKFTKIADIPMLGEAHYIELQEA